MRSTRLLTVTSAKGGKSGNKKSALAGLMKKKQEAEEAKAGQAAEGGERGTPAQYRDPEVRGLLFNITNSYYKATKKYLVEVDLEQLADAIWHADFACLAHDQFQEGGKMDPRFIYANKAALELWEASWDQMIGMPSRLSAPDDPAKQKERQALLDKTAASRGGLISNYEGWRISLTGKRFKVRGLELFNIVDFSGEKIGQAAAFREYELEDGTVVQITSEPWQPPEVKLPPTEDELRAAEAAVDQQAELVRSLKQGQGLSNQDPQVQDAVAELKLRKQYVEDLRRQMDEALAAAEAAFDAE